jgi:hypothetical protein
MGGQRSEESQRFKGTSLLGRKIWKLHRRLPVSSTARKRGAYNYVPAGPSRNDGGNASRDVTAKLLASPRRRILQSRRKIRGDAVFY